MLCFVGLFYSTTWLLYTYRLSTEWMTPLLISDILLLEENIFPVSIKIIQGVFHTIQLLQYIWIWHKKKWLRYIHSATTVFFLSHNIVCITQHYSDWKSPFLHYPFLMFDGGYRFLPSPTQPSLIDKGET